ncbi:MAG: TolC family protein [Planctomycetes bacterium]|nr:TolC family protein [Planctomycetota bacterium]
MHTHSLFVSLLLLLIAPFASHPCYTAENGVNPNAEQTDKPIEQAKNQISTPITLSMEKAARFAWNESRNVLIANSEYAAIQAQSSADTAFLNPQVYLQADYTRQDDIINNYGLRSDSDVYSYDAQTELFLYGFGKRRSAKDAAMYRAQAAESHVNNTRNQAVLLTRSAVLDIWLATALVHINQSRVTQRNNEAQDAQALNIAGTVSTLDVRHADINHARAQNQLTEVQTRLRLKEFRLIELLSPMLNETRFTLSGSLDSLPEMKELLASAQTHVYSSSELEQLDAQQKTTGALQSLNNSDRLPQFAAHAGYTGQGDEVNDTYDQWNVGVGLNWKIYDGGEISATQLQYQEQLNALSEKSLIVFDSRRRFLKSAHIQNEQLQQIISTQENVVTMAEKNYEDTRIMYQTGSTTITRLGDSGLALDESRHALIRYKYLLHSLSIELHHFIEREPTKEK